MTYGPVGNSAKCLSRQEVSEAAEVDAAGSPVQCLEDCRCSRCMEESFRINQEHAMKLDAADDPAALRRDWEAGGYDCSWEELLAWVLQGHLKQCDCQSCKSRVALREEQKVKG